MSKILWVSDNPYLSYVGQSILTRHILNRLSAMGHEVHVAGFTAIENKSLSIPDQLGYPVHVLNRGEDDKLEQIAKDVKPDIVICSHDAFLFSCLPKLRMSMPGTKFVGYFTIDGDPLHRSYREIFESCDVVVSPTEYGKRVIQRQFFDTPVWVIPYGVDRSIYCPHPNRAELVGSIAGTDIFPCNDRIKSLLSSPDTFVGIFWGHNQSKKNIGAIINAWKMADLPVDKSELMLILHSRRHKKGTIDYMGDYDYSNDIGEVQNMLIIEGIYPDPVMKSFVQMANVLLFPSIGEGFGMPLIESMSCGVIPITTNFAGATDFCHHGHNSMLVGGEFCYGDLAIRRIIANVDDLTDRIVFAYDLFQRRPEKKPLAGIRKNALFSSNTYVDVGWNELVDGALETANEPRYSWDAAAKSFNDLFGFLTAKDFGRQYVHTRV